MKNGLRSCVVTVVILIHAFIPGCKPDDIDVSTPAFSSSTLVSIAITPSNPSMAPGAKMQLEAVGTFANNTTHKLAKNVIWTSDNPGIAAVDSTGNVSSNPTGTGSVTITAASGGVTASTVITFSLLVSITVTPANPTIAPGTAQQFMAKGTLQDSAVQDLTATAIWESSNAIATISSAGLASAVQGTTGTSTITAAFSGITGTASVTSADVSSISVTPFNSTVVRGTTRQFTATAALANFATQNITSFAAWSSSSPGVAIINASGTTASISTGSAVITASFGSASGSAVLTVTEPQLVSISITPADQSIVAGAVLQFIAVGTFSDGTKQDITADVTWLSSQSEVATISNLATNGLAVAVGSGTTSISASFAGITSNHTTLTVSSPQAIGTVSISISPSGPSIPVGSSLQFTAMRISSSGATLEDITSTATWTSSNGAVAFVSQGFASAFAPGVTMITATSGNVSGTTVLTVTPF